MHYRYSMITGVSLQYKIVEFCEIPFIGYLVMTSYQSNSDKMHNASMCHGDLYLV